MSKRTIILLTTVVLLVTVGLVGFNLRKGQAPSQTANAPVTTGLSLLTSEPLQMDLIATINDSDGNTIKEVALERNASRFNVEVPSGMYEVTVSTKDGSLPPFPSQAISVSDGVLSEIVLIIPQHNDEEQ